MDRRLFLAGLLGIVGAGALASVSAPTVAEAGIPNTGDEILDELEAPAEETLGEQSALEPEQIATAGAIGGGMGAGTDVVVGGDGYAEATVAMAADVFVAIADAGKRSADAKPPMAGASVSRRLI